MTLQRETTTKKHVQNIKRQRKYGMKNQLRKKENNFQKILIFNFSNKVQRTLQLFPHPNPS